MRIVLDSNILISSLIKDSITREIILNSNNEFLLPEYSLLEIRKHENYILSKTQLSKEEFNRLIKKILEYINIVEIEKIINHKEKADKIIGDIDKDDVLLVACALAYPGSIIWSEDKHFKLQNKIRVYNTKEFISVITNSKSDG